MDLTLHETRVPQCPLDPVESAFRSAGFQFIRGPFLPGVVPRESSCLSK
jgi:hypothetical protein